MIAIQRLLPTIAYEKLRRVRSYESLTDHDPFFWTVVGVVSVSLVGLVDYLTGHELNFSLFYFLPIFLITWVANQDAGLVLSLLSLLLWTSAEHAAGKQSTDTSIYFWNTLIRGSFFVLGTHLVATLQRSWKQERLSARTDFVSGIANARYFHELLEMEIERTRRYPHPMTVVYIDIDRFKLVNDLFGHQMGDKVLRRVASELKSQLRSTDIVARVGGDEFALLLPFTDQAEAQIVISKLQSSLVEAMRRRSLPVTFSIGATTCVAPPHSSEQIIQTADQLMYEVKKSTRNAVRFTTLREEIDLIPDRVR
jgi:diguanylate cyclase (GGDEF)-like protein